MSCGHARASKIVAQTQLTCQYRIERTEGYEALGIGHIACLMNFGFPDLELASRSIRLFGGRVIPHFGG